MRCPPSVRKLSTSNVTQSGTRSTENNKSRSSNQNSSEKETAPPPGIGATLNATSVSNCGDEFHSQMKTTIVAIASAPPVKYPARPPIVPDFVRDTFLS